MKLQNQILKRPNKKPILWDAFYNESTGKKPLVIFCHGYKGFKDWGAWNLMSEQFMEQNLFFVKFNFSHNGGTMQEPIDFPDLEAFSENNYTKELDDLNDIIDHFLSKTEYLAQIDSSNISLIGHSRGGGIVILKAAEDSRVTKVITWAAVSDFGKRTSTTGDLTEWKEKGVKYVLNGRTKQKMPHKYQFYLDFKANEDRLHIESAERRLKIPHLIIHGKEDDSVSFSEAEHLHTWNPESLLLPIDNANHVFNTHHPWEENDLPNALQQVVRQSIDFVNS